jgi:hypothetical protein
MERWIKQPRQCRVCSAEDGLHKQESQVEARHFPPTTVTGCFVHDLRFDIVSQSQLI